MKWSTGGFSPRSGGIGLEDGQKAHTRPSFLTACAGKEGRAGKRTGGFSGPKIKVRAGAPRAGKERRKKGRRAGGAAQKWSGEPRSALEHDIRHRRHSPDVGDHEDLVDCRRVRLELGSCGIVRSGPGEIHGWDRWERGRGREYGGGGHRGLPSSPSSPGHGGRKCVESRERDAGASHAKRKKNQK